VRHRHSDTLTHTGEGTACWIHQLLNDPAFARRLGESGREHVRWNCLLTRHLHDYLLLFLAVEHPGESLAMLA
jgi:trehalose synthase